MGGLLASQAASATTPEVAALAVGGSALAVLGPLLDEVIFGTLDDKAALAEKKKLAKALLEIQGKIDEHDTDLATLLVGQCVQNDLSEQILAEIRNISALIKDPDFAPIPTSLENAIERIIAKKNDEQT